MRKWLVVFIALVVLSFPMAFADRPVEVMGGFSWSDNDDVGRAYAVDFNLDFPLTRLLQLGPAFGLTDIKPEGASSINTTNFGGRLGWNFSEGASGGGLAVALMWNTGSDIDSVWTVIPEAFIKFYNDNGGVRLAIARPYQFDEDDNDLFDLETTQVKAQFVWMF